jgi:vacuolar-type H+-ATPase subunit H
VNEGDAKLTSKGEMDPATQSAVDRVENFETTAEEVGSKMAKAPENVTKEDADLLHSREQRAFGETTKGGIASQAQSMASENEKKDTV